MFLELKLFVTVMAAFFIFQGCAGVAEPPPAETNLFQLGVIRPDKMPGASHGEFIVALIESTVKVSAAKRTSTWVTISLVDHQREPVQGAKIEIRWTNKSTAYFCTTNAEGKCSFVYQVTGDRTPKSLGIEIRKIEHETLAYKERANAKFVWIICPQGLDCD
jgi:hypothetical protein